MTLPEYIEAFDAPTGSTEPRGILYYIRGNVTNDQITNYVVPTESGLSAENPQGPIKWAGPWQGQESSGYYQVEFKGRFVFPTYYSLKGYDCFSYAKEWDLYGFNSNEDPTLLSSDTSIDSTYCGDDDNCVGSNCGTFKIKNTPQKAYHFFRLTHPKYEDFLFAGIEFFGIFFSKKKRRCYKSAPLRFHVKLSLLTMVIVCVS